MQSYVSQVAKSLSKDVFWESEVTGTGPGKEKCKKKKVNDKRDTWLLVMAYLSLIGGSFHVAPMQTYTNTPLRRLFRSLSPSSVLWTEMEKLEDLGSIATTLWLAQ